MNLGFPPLSYMLAVLFGGAVGSLARYLSGYFMAAWLGGTFPWATLFVNVSGSIWLGFVGTLAVHKPGTMSPELRLLLSTGLAGGFTTFSTFAYECLTLYERGDINLAGANIAANLLFGFLGVWAGALLARLL